MFTIFPDHKLNRAQIIARRILPYLINSTNILDIGCGDGFISSILSKSGKKITAVDVVNKVQAKDIAVILYDGKRLPFPDKKFDIALLLTVLHHCPKPEIVFSEAARVSKQIIVIEDICNNFLIKLLNVFVDSFQNKPLRFYWNSYKNDREWKDFLKEKGYQIKTNYFQDFPYLHGVYFLKKH